ncbi:MAG: hypothetical protein J7K85_00875 [Anaerolineaceae bacterium]|nr:hypothetical protein [Anaerolineaceae bacterium]
MYGFIQEKIINRIRQYGFRVGMVQILRAMLRTMYHVNTDIIFIIPDFKGHAYHDPCIEQLTHERIRQAAGEGALNEADVSLLSSFLAEGSQGVCAVINGKLAGYGLVQYEGEYRFGRTGRMIIPPKYAVAKNLFVFSEFRGQRLGQRLNEARLALIPAGYIPVGFIIPENRFAIRNWEMFGFQRVLQIKCWCWLASRWHIKIVRLAGGKYVDELEQVLIEGNSEKLYHS